MKTLLSIIIGIIIGAGSTIYAQTITLTFPVLGSGPNRQTDIQVLAGETLEILAWFTSYDSVLLKVAGVEITGRPAASIKQGATFAGPLSVSVLVPNDESLVFTYRKTVIASVAVQNIPSQTVAIPESTIAPADVILESSTDLNIWNSALPGSFTPSALKRFFRLRLVLH